MNYVADEANVLHKIKCFRWVKVKKYIRMVIIVFKFFIWGGISADIRSEILFYGDASAIVERTDRVLLSFVYHVEINLKLKQ